MSDLIDRQAAIIALEANKRSNEKKGQILCADEDAIIKWLKRLPSAEQKKRTEERTKTHECDCISRQAAIEALNRFSLGETDAMKLYFRMDNYLKKLPSAEPVRHGKWLPKHYYIAGHEYVSGHICSECGDDALNAEGDDFLTDFCPCCGAKMEAEHEKD